MASHPRTRFHLESEWLSIILLFLLMRLLISGITSAALWKNTPLPPSWIPADHPSLQVLSQTTANASPAARILLNGWYRWDTGYYVKIGLMGYSAQDDSVSFLPLFPLTIRILHLITHGNGLLISLILSNSFYLAALVLFYKVALLELGDSSAARNALLFFITFPSAFFLFAGYTESLFLVLILSMWLQLRKGHIQWAAFACSLSVLTRVQGLAMILPLGWQALVHLSTTKNMAPMQEIPAIGHLFFYSKELQGSLISRIATVLGAVILPLATLFFYNYGLRLNGLPTIFGAYAQRESSLVWPWIGLGEFVKRIYTIELLFSDYVDLLLLILFVNLMIIGIKKIRPALTLYSLCVLGLTFSRSYEPNLLSGFMRFALTTFPIFLVMGTINMRSPIKNMILILFIVIQLFLTWLFINWIWVA